MSLFGKPSTSLLGNPQQSQPSNPFGQTSTAPIKSSIFGSATPSASSAKPNPFGSIPANPFLQSANTQNTGGGFGGLNAATTTSQPQQSSLFGVPQGFTQQQGGGLLNQPQQQSSSIFGAPQPQQQQQQQNQPSGGIFGMNNTSTQPQSQLGTSSLFGSVGNTASTQQQPQQQQGGSLFQLGQSGQQQPQQQQGGSLFQLGQTGQQQQQDQQLGASLIQQSSRLWQQQDMLPPPRSVTEQMEVAFAKWNPQSPSCLFQTYLYNTVAPEHAPFYAPSAQDNEAKWEEALRKKPTPGSIPVIVKGFEQLGRRAVLQNSCLSILQGRLHEINDGLTELLRKHDLQISIRAAECKRKHSRISEQCLRLATKVQVLRNRGYAMDSTEEELKEKLLKLQRSVFDPALNGRGEEIWARMVGVRERGRQLQREFERADRTTGDDQEIGMDEEVMKRAKKILEDYNSQLSHLTKELTQLQKDLTEWEAGKPTISINGPTR